MHAHLYEDSRPPSERGVPREFDRVIARALVKDPARRYPSTGDLGRAALGAARGEPVTESERSVAVGQAAPNGAGNGDVTRVIGDEAVTAWDAAAHEPTGVTARVIRPRRWPARMVVAVAAFAGLVTIGLLAGVLLGDGGGAAARTGPLTEDEVRGAAEAFGDAYAAEDPAALRRTLARDVLRVLPGGRSQGREQVVDQYARQFDGKVEGYELDSLVVRGGRAGRVTGSYRVDRDGGDPYEGRIVFGVVRERGEPRIALIAATPRT